MFIRLSQHVTGYAEDNPAQTFVTALACFSNKFVSANHAHNAISCYTNIIRSSILFLIDFVLIWSDQIYAGCTEAYRLNESGEFNVPPEATNSFCHGPCFEETQQVLNCVDRMFSNFVFGNRATLPELRSALRAGCSYTNQIGKRKESQKLMSSSPALCRTSCL